MGLVRTGAARAAGAPGGGGPASAVSAGKWGRGAACSSDSARHCVSHLAQRGSPAGGGRAMEPRNPRCGLRDGGWPGKCHTTAAVKVERSNGTLQVDREIEGGASEVQELQAPCLVSVLTGLNQVRYASLKGIRQA